MECVGEYVRTPTLVILRLTYLKLQWHERWISGAGPEPHCENSQREQCTWWVSVMFIFGEDELTRSKYRQALMKGMGSSGNRDRALVDIFSSVQVDSKLASNRSLPVEPVGSWGQVVVVCVDSKSPVSWQTKGVWIFVSMDTPNTTQRWVHKLLSKTAAYFGKGPRRYQWRHMRWLNWFSMQDVSLLTSL